MTVEQDLFTPLLKPNNFKPYFTDHKNQIVRFVDLFAGLGDYVWDLNKLYLV
ncbi:hypothetical protein ACEWYV_05225 [Helicobacter pylori]